MTDPAFVHLRLHSEFSIADGTVRIDQAVGAAVADAMPALAITDLANAFGLVMHRTVQGMEAAIPVIADVHHPTTDRTVPVQDIEFPQSKIRVRRPSVSHPADLRDHEPSVDS